MPNQSEAALDVSAEAANHPGTLSPAAPDAESAAERMRILMVDDRPDNLLALEQVLGDAQYELVKAFSGPEALRHVLMQDFALILMDVSMPGMDGFETAAHIRAREHSRQTPIIFVTATEDARGRMFEGYAAGAVDYILKPVAPVILRSKVAVFAELAQARAALARHARKLEHRVELIMNAAGEGVAGMDLSGRITFINPAGAWALGYPVEALLGQPMHQLVHHTRPDGQRHRQEDCPIHRAVVEGAVRRVTCDTFWRKDGGSFPVEYVTSPIPEGGRVAGAVVVFSDRTEQLRAEQEIRRLNADLDRRVTERTAQLQAVNQELEAFSYSVSHDLRAPLRAVEGFSRALLEDYGQTLDAGGRHFVERIRAGSEHMGLLIEDLLRLSRVSRGDLRLGPVDLSALARSVADELRARQPGRSVTFEIQPGLMAHADAALVRALLENLLGNSWKYTSRHPTARIELGQSLRDGRPMYFVRDDGAGFDQAYADKLFAAFQRLHTREEFEGTGIGLATVRRIVSRHSGTVCAEGEVEKGATFYFTLAPAGAERVAGVNPPS